MVIADGGLWNENVRELQAALNDLGADPPLDVNGIISNTTIRKLQIAANSVGGSFTVDGGLGNDAILELQIFVGDAQSGSGSEPVDLSTALFDLNEREIDSEGRSYLFYMSTHPASTGAVTLSFSGAYTGDLTLTAAQANALFDTPNPEGVATALNAALGTDLITVESDEDVATVYHVYSNAGNVPLDMEETANTLDPAASFWWALIEVEQTVWPDQTGNGNDAYAGDGGRGVYHGTHFVSDATGLTFHAGPSYSTGGFSTLHIGAPFNDDVVLAFDVIVEDVTTALCDVTGFNTWSTGGTDSDLLEDNVAIAYVWQDEGDAPTCTLDVSTLTQPDGPGLIGGAAGFDPDADGSMGFVVGFDAHGSTLTAVYDNDSAMWVPGVQGRSLYYVWIPGDEYADSIGDGTETCPIGYGEDEEWGDYDDAYGYVDDPESSYIAPYWGNASQYGGPQAGEAMLVTVVFSLEADEEQLGFMQHVDGPVMDAQTMWDLERDNVNHPPGLLLLNYTGGGYCAPGRLPRAIEFDARHTLEESESVRDQIIAWAADNGVTITKRDVADPPEPPEPPEPGVLSGTVFDPDLVPLAGVTVDLVHDESVVEATTTTAVDGTYSLAYAVLNNSYYGIRATKDDPGLAETWFTGSDETGPLGAPNWNSAAYVDTSSGGDVADLDIKMLEA